MVKEAKLKLGKGRTLYFRIHRWKGFKKTSVYIFYGLWESTITLGWVSVEYERYIEEGKDEA